MLRNETRVNFMLKDFLKDESGLETVEYSLMAMTFVVAVLVGAAALAAAVDARMDVATAVF